MKDLTCDGCGRYRDTPEHHYICEVPEQLVSRSWYARSLRDEMDAWDEDEKHKRERFGTWIADEDWS